MNSSPVFKTIIYFFIFLILTGTALLCLPFARQNNAVFSFLTCLFTSTSAVCVTGLSVVNINDYFSVYGQIIILFLLQIGALGYMLVSTGIGLVLGKMALKDRKIMQEMFDISSFNDLKKLLLKAVAVVLSIEAAGALVLAFSFVKTMPIGKALYYGIFYSVCSFSNAGFSLLDNSVESLASSPAVLYSMIVLIIFGGIGFFVLVDIIDKIRGHNIKLTFHSKVVLWMTFSLIVFGFIAFFANDFLRLSAEGKTFSFIVNNSLFQAVSARTAGFNSLPMNTMTSFLTFVIIILMFVGGAPGSTAGGLKITTLMLVFVFIRSVLKNDDSYPFAGRTMDIDSVRKALAVFVLMTFLVILFCLAVLLAEPALDTVKVIFEVVSGFCTVGLSLGITAELSDVSRYIMVLAMLIGRIGAITILVYLLSGDFKQKNIKYPEGRLLIG